MGKMNPLEKCEKCPDFIFEDVQVYIQQLEAENAELLEKIKQLEKKLNAAIHDCGMFPCQTCEEKDNGDLCPMCTVKGSYRSLHQWRGLCAENGGNA